jgi:4-amino-4-deoxy-L-arabinose transferase-like glycosyltransferase
MQLFWKIQEMASSVATLRIARLSLPIELSRQGWYALFFLAGFVFRFGFVIWARTFVGSPTTITPFGAEVCRLAAHIAAGHGFHSPFQGVETGPSAWVAPAYPYLVALVFRFFGDYTATSALILLGLQCALGAATAIPIYSLGTRTFGQRVGYGAACIWTFGPIFFRWPTSWIWDFAASALLLSLIFIAALEAGEKGTTANWLRLAGLWGLSALTNPALLSLMPFTFLQAAWMNRKAGVPYTRRLFYALAVFGLMVSPWLIRNYRVFGRPVFLRDNFWFEFSLGNYHNSNGMGWGGKHPDGNPLIREQAAKLGELEFIHYHKNEALEFLRQYPGEFAALTSGRIRWFWDGTPTLFMASEWWQPWEYWPLSALGLLGLFFVLTRRPRGWLLYAAALVIYPIPYYLTFAHPKYRYAIEPEMLLLSVYLVSVLWSEITKRKSSQPVQ